MASLEFAAGALVLFMLIQMLIETAWQITTQIALEQGARSAVRFAITGGSTLAGGAGAPGCRAATIVWLVTNGSPGLLLPSRLTASSSVGGGAAAASGAQGFAGARSQTVKYTFTYQQSYLTPLARSVLGGASYLHSVTIAAENEPFPNQPC